MIGSKVRLEFVQPDKPCATGVKLYVDGVVKKITSISFTDSENVKLDIKKERMENGTLVWCEFVAGVEFTDGEARITII